MVRNVPDNGSDPVAEHAIAMLFALRLALPVYAAAAHDGRWSASCRRRADELPLDESLAQSDALTLHLPLTPETRNLIDAHALRGMKRDAILSHTGRSALVDAAALADALRKGEVAGAAIDVLDVEPPPPDHPLRAAGIPNLLLTPHVAWASDAAQAKLAARLQDLVTAQSASLAAGAVAG